MVIQIMTRNISSTMWDSDLSDLVSTDHQQKMTNCGSSGHVTDDITWPKRVKGQDRGPEMFEAQYLGNRAR